MKEIKFDWDKNKATKNLVKHKVSFEEAQSVFDDDNARLIFDPDHSEDEENIIRLISARKATKKEAINYKELL